MFKKILPLTHSKLKILCALYTEKELNLASISKKINMPSSNIIKNLPSLKAILEIKKLGNIKIYSIKKDYIKYIEPIIERFRLETNLGKNIEIIDLIKKIPYITEIYLFGSYAKGTAKKESDIDLIIITELKNIIEKEINNIKKITPVPISTIYINNKKLNDIKNKTNSRFYNILTNKNQRIKVI